MRLEMRTQGVELTEKLRAHIEERLRSTLARFSRRLARVHVLVEDVNGPRGGYDIQCKVRAELSRNGQLVIREVHHDPFAAVVRATERVSHAVSRRLERLGARRRGGTRRRARRVVRSAS